MANVKTGIVIGVGLTLTLVLVIGALVFGVDTGGAVETTSNAGAGLFEIAIRSVLGGIWNVFGGWLWLPVIFLLVWLFALMNG